MSQSQVTRRDFVKSASVTAAGAGLIGASHAAAETPDVTKTRSYNENMEYRRLGRTNFMVSAVSMGGHWKRIPFKPGSDEFKKNRREVMAAALDHGINFIDACSAGEVIAYTEALGKRREAIYFAFDWHGGRNPNLAGSVDAMKKQLDDGLKRAKLEYVDLWRVTLREQCSFNTPKEMEAMTAAFDWAKKAGKARFGGYSGHHRPWIAEAVAKYDHFDVIVTPYAAGSKQKPQGSMFEALKKHDVGMVGIKPFASGTLFKSRGVPDSATKEEDDQRARMALRYVLCCDVLSCSIPGLITVDQVKNAAASVQERREFDLAETKQFQQMTDEMWANLPRKYEWLKEWEWV